MLIQFSITNFKTFKEKATLSLVASNYDTDTREEENVIDDKKNKLRLLKSAVMYGANASGKSKFIEALEFMKFFVLSSSRDGQKDDPIAVIPFKLNTETIDAPSEFEVVFIHQDIYYRYGFEVDSQKVVAEWLYYKPKTKEIELFYREEQEFEIHKRDFPTGKILIKGSLVRPNALMLSVAAQFNDEKASAILNWFARIDILSVKNFELSQAFSNSLVQNPLYRKKLLALLETADFGIKDITYEDFTWPLITKEDGTKHVNLYVDIATYHKRTNANNEIVDTVKFSMDNDESEGTKKYFSLLGLILDVLENGDILIADELDAKLHPNLVNKIISLFNSKVINTKNAQLIFNTHDTNLLNSGLFRRDQIWFIEKDKYGAASLYSLADFKTKDVRKTEAFEENYIRGKYGAVPFLGLFDTLLEDNTIIIDEKDR